MKALSDLKTVTTRPGLVLKRQRQSLEKAKEKARTQAELIASLRGQVRDLQQSRDQWKAATLAAREKTAAESVVPPFQKKS